MKNKGQVIGPSEEGGKLSVGGPARYCGNSSGADVRAHHNERSALRSVKGRWRAAKP